MAPADAGKERDAGGACDAEKQPDEKPNIGTELEGFITHIEALETNLPLLMLLMLGHSGASCDKFLAFLRSNGEFVEKTETGESFRLNEVFVPMADRLERMVAHASVGVEILPVSFVVALVSQFDFFLSRLLRCLFYMQPEMLIASERQLTFGQLMQFPSIEAAREHVLEKEIENVLRSSHADQFTWLENRFKIELRKDLKIWPAFLELTERRNLFVHCNGVVSSQYVAVCKAHGNDEKVLPKVGTRLTADIHYFSKAQACIFEMGVKLAHVLWRKVGPQERKAADDSINNIVLDLIIGEKYPRAIVVANFALNTLLRKESSEINRRMLAVNLAQAYKWSGKVNEAEQELAKYDWSACADEFKLALLVLRDKFDDAARLMVRVGKSGYVDEAAYQHWPLFKAFRTTEQFANAYQKVFEKPYVAIQMVPGPVLNSNKQIPTSDVPHDYMI